MAIGQKAGRVNHYISDVSFNRVLEMMRGYPATFGNLMQEINWLREDAIIFWVNARELPKLSTLDLLKGISDVENSLGQAKILTGVANEVLASPVWEDHPYYFEERDELSEMQEALEVQQTRLQSTLRRLLDALSWAERFEEFDPTHDPRLWRAKWIAPRNPRNCDYKGWHRFIPGNHKHSRVDRLYDEADHGPKKGPRFSSARKARENERQSLIDQLAA